MPGFRSVGGVHIKITPSPDNLPTPTPNDTPQTGDIEMTCINYSCIPADADLHWLRSHDPHVAITRAGNQNSVHIPARPSRRSAKYPSTNGSSIGIWQPNGNKGQTIVEAVFDVQTTSAILGQIQPDAEIIAT